MPARTSKPAHRTNYYVGRLKAVMYIVIHTGETDEGATPAEGMGNWFGQEHPPGQRSSAHQGADTDSICTYVGDSNTAFGAPNVNANGWHLEHAGRAGQTSAQWDDDASRLILANGAIAAAEASKRLGIPARWLTDAQLRAGNVKGFITHAQASRVLGGTHWDPGPNFPAEHYMALVKANLGGTTATTAPATNQPAAPKEWDDMASKEDIKNAVREVLKEDGLVPSPFIKSNPSVAPVTALSYAMQWALQSRDRSLDPVALAQAVAASVNPNINVDDLAKAIVVELGKD